LIRQHFSKVLPTPANNNVISLFANNFFLIFHDFSGIFFAAHQLFVFVHFGFAAQLTGS